MFIEITETISVDFKVKKLINADSISQVYRHATTPDKTTIILSQRTDKPSIVFADESYDDIKKMLEGRSVED